MKSADHKQRNQFIAIFGLALVIILVGFFASVRRNKYVDEPNQQADLRLTQPIIQTGDPMLGANDAKNTLVLFSDFTCPHCAEFAKTTKLLAKKYGQQIKIIWKDAPINPTASTLLIHQAAQCANQQDSFWPYHDRLFNNQKAQNLVSLKRLANELSLDKEKFRTCLENDILKQKVLNNREQAMALGIDGVPYFFFNDKPFSGALSFDQLEYQLQNQ